MAVAQNGPLDAPRLGNSGIVKRPSIGPVPAKSRGTMPPNILKPVVCSPSQSDFCLVGFLDGHAGLKQLLPAATE